jgi:ligand-binding SRPBCC domain-containing protein
VGRVRTFIFESELWLPRARAEVFPFFADVGNLERITPPWLHFRVLTPPPVVMGEGAVIDYRLRVRGLPLRWRARISAWEPPGRFVDEQLRGPYRMWVHEHTFAEERGGVRCRDHVRYAVPGGALVDALVGRRDVARIFAFQAHAVSEIFARRPLTAASADSAALP